MTDIFLGLAKVQTFRRDLNRLRDAIYASDDYDVYEAWHQFERWTDCINPNGKEKSDG